MANNNSCNIPLDISSGAVTKPLQASFCVKLSSDQVNITGDGTAASINFDTEYWDIGSNFDISTHVFTAPITGMYMFGTQIGMKDVPTPTDCFLGVVTTARTYNASYCNGQIKTSTNLLSLSELFVLPMTASDTVYIGIVCSGSTKTIDIASGDSSIFWGYLIG
jgi:hypothetical protein